MAVKLVLEDLRAPAGEGTSQLVPQLLQSVHGARDEVKRALHFGVQCSFAIARTHYVNIDLQEMSWGLVPGYDDAELDQIKDLLPVSWLKRWRTRSPSKSRHLFRVLLGRLIQTC
ncbi:hypothetical protein PVAP13_7KG019809 [Panicum virgatum]|uniref:Uncharacterized protein n=1 Tax=Panicum virgatum TaxID=38727 RepID=A0A8T0QDD8_PANVG|nr:hypothetical protein PVAP13_7KG019809 [Panicum virgatum]